MRIVGLAIAAVGVVVGIVGHIGRCSRPRGTSRSREPLDAIVRWVEINLGSATDAVKNFVLGVPARPDPGRPHERALVAASRRRGRYRGDRELRVRAAIVVAIALGPDRRPPGLGARDADPADGHRRGHHHDGHRDRARGLGGSQSPRLGHPAPAQRRRADAARRSSTCCRRSRSSAPAASPRSSPRSSTRCRRSSGSSRTACAASRRRSWRRRPRAAPSRFQLIVKVLLPMARRSLLVATNQGVVLVLAMVVLGGLVGAQALGLRRRRRVLAARLLRTGHRGGARHRPARRHARPDHPGGRRTSLGPRGGRPARVSA